MPLTEAQLDELRAEYYAEDVPINEEMLSWSEDQAREFFDSGGTKLPGAAAAPALQGLFALPAQKLITGAELPMAAIAGKPVLIMNVASR